MLLVVVSTEPATGGGSPPTAASPHRSIGVLLTAAATPAQVCTAAVVDSTAGDVIVTAAHCVSGSTRTLLFAPAYHAGQTPFGTWIVDRIYVAPEWKARADPDSDYAFLVVSASPHNQFGEPVEQVVGGNRLGRTPAVGAQVSVAGYPIERSGQSIGCDTRVEQAHGFPEMRCVGFSDGTSGSPMLLDADPVTGRGTITGVIGGLEAGGCSPDISYMSPFTNTTEQVFKRAESKSSADPLPLPAPADSCP